MEFTAEKSGVASPVRSGRGERQQGKPPANRGQKSGEQGGNDLKAAIESARQQMKEKNFAEATRILERVFEQNPDFPPAYLCMGNIYAAKGDYDQAIEYYEGALHLKKEMPVALMMLGNVYVKKEMFDKALEKLKAAIALKPSLEKGHLNMARVYQKMERPDEALQCLQEALEHNPQSDQARIALAGLYRELGKTGDAKKELEGVLQRDEDSWQARLELARLMSGPEESIKVISLLSEAAKLKPDSVRIKFLLGRKYFELGRYDDALRVFASVLESKPQNVLAQIEVARIKAAKGSLADARKILVKLTKGERSLGTVHRRLAEVLIQEGRYSEAVAEFRASILHNEKLAKRHPELTAALEAKGSDEDVAKGCMEAFARVAATGKSKGGDDGVEEEV